jgi:hypothetical protein
LESGRFLTSRVLKIHPKQSKLLGYDPACDAPACIPRRVARVIILARVDHDRSAARTKNRVGLVFVECDGSIEDLDVKTAIRWDVQVRHIAGVPGTRHHSVMRVGRIEVPAGRREIGRFAFSDRMNVEGVLTAGHASDGKTDQDACLRLSEGRYADILALRVLERSFGSRGIFRGSGPEQDNGAESGYATDEFHDLISLKPSQLWPIRRDELRT